MTNQSQIWELDYKESWALKNWCFWTVVLEKTLESPLDYKEIQPVHPKGNQSWVFIGRTDVETETPILWPPDLYSTELRNKDVFAYYKLHSVRLWTWETGTNEFQFLSPFLSLILILSSLPMVSKGIRLSHWTEALYQFFGDDSTPYLFIY